MQNKVVWREGLFIRPQHFQQNDRYYIYELMNRSIQSRQNNWGLFDLVIDEDLLKSGKITITKASGILPDGTLFDISSQTQPLTFDVKPDHTNKIVYLLLPIIINDGDEIFFENQKTLQTRYKAKTINNIPNTNTGENSSSDLVVAQHNFKLATQEGISSSHIKIEIAKIGNVSANGSLTLDENFSPTYLHLNNSKKLLSKTQELLTMITYRANVLSQNISDSKIQSAELGHYLMLQLLNKTEARIQYMLSQLKLHPDELFLELLSFNAELAVFYKKERRILNHQQYVHIEQYNSFVAIIDEIKIMLESVLEQNSISLPVEKRKYGIYIAPIKDKTIINSSTFIFAVSAQMSSQKIKEILLNSLKLGTIETIKNLVNYHLVGFKLRTLSNAPKEIPYKVNYLYFSIELTEENKKELQKSSGFAFYLSNDIPDIQYALWAIKNI